MYCPFCPFTRHEWTPHVPFFSLPLTSLSLSKSRLNMHVFHQALDLEFHFQCTFKTLGLYSDVAGPPPRYQPAAGTQATVEAPQTGSASLSASLSSSFRSNLVSTLPSVANVRPATSPSPVPSIGHTPRQPRLPSPAAPATQFHPPSHELAARRVAMSLTLKLTSLFVRTAAKPIGVSSPPGPGPRLPARVHLADRAGRRRPPARRTELDQDASARARTLPAHVRRVCAAPAPPRHAPQAGPAAGLVGAAGAAGRARGQSRRRRRRRLRTRFRQTARPAAQQLAQQRQQRQQLQHQQQQLQHQQQLQQQQQLQRTLHPAAERSARHRLGRQLHQRGLPLRSRRRAHRVRGVALAPQGGHAPRGRRGQARAPAGHGRPARGRARGRAELGRGAGAEPAAGAGERLARRVDTTTTTTTVRITTNTTIRSPACSPAPASRLHHRHSRRSTTTRSVTTIRRSPHLPHKPAIQPHACGAFSAHRPCPAVAVVHDQRSSIRSRETTDGQEEEEAGYAA